MKLIDLDPMFVRNETRLTTVTMIVGDHETWVARGRPTEERIEPRERIIKVDLLEQAQGIWFLCPTCFAKNGGRIGTHSIQVGFHGRGLLDDQSSQNKEGKPSRWNVSGTSLEDLSLSPSVDCVCWHGHVTKGSIT